MPLFLFRRLWVKGAFIVLSLGSHCPGNGHLDAEIGPSRTPRPGPWAPERRPLRGRASTEPDRQIAKTVDELPPTPSEVLRFSHGGVDAPISQTCDGKLPKPQFLRIFSCFLETLSIWMV